MSKRNIRKKRNIKEVPTFKQLVKAGQDKRKSLLDQLNEMRKGWSEPEVEQNHQEHEHGEHCDHEH